MRDPPIQLTQIPEHIRQVGGLELLENQIRKLGALASAREACALKEKVREEIGYDPDQTSASQEKTVLFENVDGGDDFVLPDFQDFRRRFNK